MLHAANVGFLLGHTHAHMYLYAHLDIHTLAHMHNVVRGGGGGGVRAFTGRAGVRLSEPWTAHVKLIQCGLLTCVRTGCSIPGTSQNTSDDSACTHFT